MSLSRSCAARSIYLSRENRLRNGMSSPLPPAKVQLVIEQAVVHVDSIGRESVTGAPEILDSWPDSFLSDQEMTRYDATTFICHGIVKHAAASPSGMAAP
jgi:ATP-dependent Clp protease ATP-binding subunit ClpA